MDWFYIFLQIIQWTLILYIGATIIYLFVFGIAGLWPYKKSIALISKKRKYTVLIPGYKEDAVIIEVAKRALNQNYPTPLFEVVIIADSFKPETILDLKQLPITVIEVQFEKSTKAKALNKAMDLLGDDYDVALVLDADNIMEADFISKIDRTFDMGYQVVQGHRIAKNTNNSMAVLDAISEEINNHIFRKAHRVLGLSSALIGSGMAFNYKLFKKTMLSIDAIGGFDKQLEMWLLKNKFVIEYVENALVEDEKVQKSEVFANQRRRWLSAQFIYFWKNIGSALLHLFTRGNIDYFDKVIQMGQLPRIILLGLTGGITTAYLIGFLLFEFEPVLTLLWIIALALLKIALLLSVPKKYYNSQTLKALKTIPLGFFLMLKSLIKFKGANKKFIHTQHGSI